MGVCVAFGCNNREKKKKTGSTKVKNFSLHRFPKDPKLKEKWIRAIRRDNWEPTEHSRVCSDHFKENDYDNSSPFRRYLKNDAVPSVFPAFPPHLQPSASPKTPRRVSKRSPSPIISPLPEKIAKTELEVKSEELERTKRELVETRKKLRNITLKQKRLEAKVASLKDIAIKLHEQNVFLSEQGDLLKNIPKNSFCLVKIEPQEITIPK